MLTARDEALERDLQRLQIEARAEPRGALER
jgi:hypothetical protein